MVLVATASPDYVSFPSTGCIEQEVIRARNAVAMDTPGRRGPIRLRGGNGEGAHRPRVKCCPTSGTTRCHEILCKEKRP